MTLNDILTAILAVYVIWMAVSETRRESASAATLTAEQLDAFNASYGVTRPLTDYPTALQPHAAIAQRARIRKVVAAIVLGAIAFAFLFLRP